MRRTRRDPHARTRRDYAVRGETYGDYSVIGETDPDTLRSWMGRRVRFRRCMTGAGDTGTLTEVGSLSATVTDEHGEEHSNLIYQMGIELA